MSDQVILEIVKTTGIIVTAILSTVVTIWTIKARKEQKETNIKIDGRLTQLLEEKSKSSRLEGHAQGVSDQKAEANAPVVSAPIELKIGKLEVEMKPPVKPE